jgi:hypothetical protein
MRFLKEKSGDSMLFPRPEDGREVRISPPGFTWLPAEGAFGYRVEVYANGSTVYQKTIGTDPVHLPDVVLEPGKYTWDVIALDAKGNSGIRRGKKSFTIPEAIPELPWIEPEVLLSRVPEGHSRLIYLKEDLPAIRDTLNTTRQNIWERCLRAAERSLDMPAPEYPKYHLTEDRRRSRLEYGKYFAYFRRHIDSALMNLSLAFLMTKEEKYSKAAKRILMEVTSWPTDDDDVTSVSAKWGDEPGLSMSRCAHRAYDWLYQALSQEERAKVQKMCEERAWQTYRRLKRQNFLTNPGSSHNGRLIAYLSEMAIVMAGESEGAKTWLDYSLRALTTLYPHWGGYEGGWAEGVPYGLWYNTVYIPAFEGLLAAMDVDIWKRPFFRNVRYFFFYCTALRGEIRPFGDSAEGAGPGERGGGGYASLLWHHAHRFNDPHMAWWVDQIDGWGGPSGETSLIFEEHIESKPPTDLPNSRVFRGVGWAGLHSDITKPDDDTFLLFKSSPYGSVSHSHADQNSFAIMKGGKALAIPSGYYGPSYGMPHHAEWTRSTKANNCVLVNGEGQVIRNARASGWVLRFEDQTGFTYVSGDATPAYMGKMKKFHRHILLLRPNLILILDDLESPEPALFQWMLHAFDKMEIYESKGKVTSRRGDAAMDVFLRSPAGITISQTDQFDTPYNAGIPEDFHRDKPNQWHVTAETDGKSSAVRIGAVTYVSGRNQRFDVDIPELEGWLGGRVNSPSGKVEGWIQLKPDAPGPDGYGDKVMRGKAMLCGISADGNRFVF